MATGAQVSARRSSHPRRAREPGARGRRPAGRMASRVWRQRSLRPQAGRRALPRGPRRRGDRGAEGVRGGGRPGGAGRRPARPTWATARRCCWPAASSARCPRPPAATPASGSTPPARRSPAAYAERLAELEAERDARVLAEERVDVTLPWDRTPRRPAPADHAHRADRRHLRGHGLRGRRRPGARGGVAELRRAQHQPRPPGPHDDGHVLRRARGLRPGPAHPHQPVQARTMLERRRRSTSSRPAGSTGPTSSTRRTPRSSTRSRAWRSTAG